MAESAHPFPGDAATMVLSTPLQVVNITVETVTVAGAAHSLVKPESCQNFTAHEILCFPFSSSQHHKPHINLLAHKHTFHRALGSERSNTTVDVHGWRMHPFMHPAQSEWVGHTPGVSKGSTDIAVSQLDRRSASPKDQIACSSLCRRDHSFLSRKSQGSPVLRSKGLAPLFSAALFKTACTMFKVWCSTW